MNDCLHAPLDLTFGVIVHSYQEHQPDYLELKFYPLAPLLDLPRFLERTAFDPPLSTFELSNYSNYVSLALGLGSHKRVGFRAFV